MLCGPLKQLESDDVALERINDDTRLFRLAESEDPEDREFYARLKFLELILEASNSTIESHRILILVDLQGVYLALHEWLEDNGFPLDDGFVISRFAYFQIRRTFTEVARRVASIRPGKFAYIQDLFDQIKVTKKDGKFYPAKDFEIQQNVTYLDVTPKFEIFYAPVPLRDLEWQLRKESNSGDYESTSQLHKIKQGIVVRKNLFERNYAAYKNFVDELKSVVEHGGSHRGFFNFAVRRGGIRYFDEKEVDTRIIMRAMDALHNSDADSLCIVSSDQDFLPFHRRAQSQGVPSFQADLAKFRVGDNVGKRLRELGVHFIQGGIDPVWPLEIITDAISDRKKGQRAKYDLLKDEIDSLCKLHNEMNDFKVDLLISSDGAVDFKLSKPLD